MKVTLKRLARSLLPRPALIRLYRRAATHYLGTISAPPPDGKPTVVIFNHFFDQDVRALGYCRETVHYVVLDAPRLFRGAKLFFRPDVQRLLAPYDSEPEANRRAYHAECAILFDHIQRRFDPKAILLTADNFYWAREIVAIAKQRGIKTLVVDKEGVVTPHYYEAGAERYRRYAPFVSDHIFVYSERQKAYWQAAGAPANRISVVGQLRSDLFHREQRAEVDGLFPVAQPIVTLFSYEDDAYITMLQDGPRRTWQQMKGQTHDAVFALAGANPRYNFVIKTHPQQSDLEDLTTRYGGLPNLRVVGGSALGNELIQRSELIIAFQTTAVIEAMFMDKRVIYTAWDPNYAHFADNILPFHEAPGVQVATTFAAFEQLCEAFFAGNLDRFELDAETRQARAAFVDTYLFRPDGHACERFSHSLSEILA